MNELLTRMGLMMEVDIQHHTDIYLHMCIKTTAYHYEVLWIYYFNALTGTIKQ